MLGRLLLLFIVVPLVELALLLWVAQYIGPWTTFALVIVTGVVGALLVKAQGWWTYRRIVAELSRGQLPAQAMLDALLIVTAGALLVTPGILTDIVGFLLLLPLTRGRFRAALVRYFRSRFTFVQQPGRTQIVDSYVVDADDPQHGGPGRGPRPVDEREEPRRMDGSPPDAEPPEGPR